MKKYCSKEGVGSVQAPHAAGVQWDKAVKPFVEVQATRWTSVSLTSASFMSSKLYSTLLTARWQELPFTFCVLLHGGVWTLTAAVFYEVAEDIVQK